MAIVNTTGKKNKKVAKHIKNQPKEDKMNEQRTFKEFKDLFKSSK